MSAPNSKDLLFLGIDSGAQRHWWVALDSHGSQQGSQAIANEHEGYRALLDQIHQWQASGYLIYVAAEGKGGYMSPLDSYLGEADCVYHNIGSKQLRRYREMMGYPLDKDDQHDAHHLAELLHWLVHHGQERSSPSQDVYYEELRQVERSFTELTETKVSLHNTLVSRVRSYWPELVTEDRYFHSTDAQGLLVLLQWYPTPRKVVEAGVNAVAAVLSQATGQDQQALARRLVEDAKAIPPQKHVTASRVRAIKSMAAALKDTKQTLRQLEKELQELLDRHPFGRALLETPGIGVRTAAVFMGEAGDLDSFASEAKLARYAGTGAVKTQTGTSRERYHDNAQYNHRLKRAVILMAQSRYLHHEESRRYVQTRKTSPDDHWSLIKKLARYLIRRLWITWKNLVDNQGIDIEPAYG